MRKSAIVIAFGAFFLTLALLLKFYAYPRLAVIPKDQNTSQTLVDEKANFLDVASLSFKKDSPIQTTATVVADEKAAKGISDDALVLNQWQYTDSVENAKKQQGDKTKNPPISATVQRYAIDRKTGKTLKWDGTELNGEKVDYQGSYTIKLPFNVEKKTYPYFDTTLAKPVNLEFKGEEKVRDMETYKFQVVIPDTVFTKQEVPGSLFGLPKESPAQNADRSYGNQITVWADPITGVFMKMEQHQVQKLTVPNREPITVMDTTSVFTDDTIKKNVDDYSSKGKSLNALSVAPWVLMPLGLILLVVGAIMAVMSKSRREPRH